MEKEKNKERFDHEIRPLMPKVMTWAYHFTKDVHKASDLTQNVLLKAYQKMDQLEEGTNAQAWVSTITRNTFLNSIRGKRIMDSTDDPVQYETIDTAGQIELCWDGDDPLWAHTEFGDEVSEALKSLPERKQTLLLFVDFWNLKYAEAAKAYSALYDEVISEDMVRSRLHRIRKTLKDNLRSYASAEYNIS